MLRYLVILSFAFCGASPSITASEANKYFASELNTIEKKLNSELKTDDLKAILGRLYEIRIRLDTCLELPKSDATLTDEQTQCSKQKQQAEELVATTASALNKKSFFRYKSQTESYFKKVQEPDHYDLSGLTLSNRDLLATAIILLLFIIVTILDKLDSLILTSKPGGTHLVSLISATTLFLSMSLLSEPLSDFNAYWQAIIFGGVVYIAKKKDFTLKSIVVSFFVLTFASLSSGFILEPVEGVEFVTDDLLLLNLWLFLTLYLMSPKNGWAKRVFFLFFITVNGFELFGYHFLAHQLVLSVIAIRLCWLFYGLVYHSVPLISGFLLGIINAVPYSSLKAFDFQHITGRRWVEIGVGLLALCLLISAQIELFGLPDAYAEALHFAINDHISIGTIQFSIIDLLSGTIIFGLLLGFSRFIQFYIDYRNRDEEQKASDTISAIFWYGAVVTSALVGLSVAGFSVQNLALIAGAFSIGIGFGLQNIVSNFVSGIILLIEQPIKKGDWIILGNNTEGLVKKVSIRATEIQTFDRADIIVPNSDLISQQVTNWMLNDSIGRLKVSVGVAYGTDVEKVRDILEAVTKAQSEIITDDANYPIVILFMGFGDSSLDFEIRAFLKDVENTHRTRSNINFAINKAFAQEGIEIPFPQRDLHIRSGLIQDHNNESK